MAPASWACSGTKMVWPSFIPELSYHVGLGDDMEVGGRAVLTAGLLELDAKYRFLHTGDMVDVAVPDGFVFDQISLNSTLANADLVCSVPNMKMHALAGVSLGMKNMMGAYPGSVYGAPLCSVHELASKLEPQGTAPAVVDIVRATKPGLTVVSAVAALCFTHKSGVKLGISVQ